MMIVLLPTAIELSPTLGKQSRLSEISGNADVRDWARRLLNRLSGQGTGSSNRILRALILSEPLSMESGEMTDKGSINQRAILKNRAQWVERMYAAQAEDDVVLVAANRV